MIPLPRPVLMLALALAFVGLATEAGAQGRCRVMDPTGTPLNIRTAPQGRVIGQIRNGVLVSIAGERRDSSGRPWVYIGSYETGQPIGWVWREFIACF